MRNTLEAGSARLRAAGPGALAVVAALTLGFVVGDASASTKKGAATTGGASDQETMEWSWKLAQGKTIEVKGVNGEIRARRASGDKVEVRAWKHAHRSDPASVRVEFVEHAGGVTVCVIYPSGRYDRPNECTPGEGGHSSVHDNDVEVDFEVLVPDGVDFAGRTVNGSVEAESLKGTVSAHTVNAQIRVSTSKQAEAETVNGSITARLGSAVGDRLDFSTVNGSITLDLPEDLNAEFHAETLNGTIDSDFPITVHGSISHRRILGTIGKGGPSLHLETVNGSIRLRKASI